LLYHLEPFDYALRVDSVKDLYQTEALPKSAAILERMGLTC